MFIPTKLLNITRSGVSGSACWDPLKQGLYEPCTICPRQKARQTLLSMCNLSGQTHFSLLCMHAYNLNDCQVWVSLIQFTFFPSPFMPISCPPIKNAPRWLVKRRWEWRLGLFKDCSQLFKAKFDSENGGGLISHAQVFEGSGTECNARCSDETSTSVSQREMSAVYEAWQVLNPSFVNTP